MDKETPEQVLEADRKAAWEALASLRKLIGSVKFHDNEKQNFLLSKEQFRVVENVFTKVSAALPYRP